MTNHSVIGHKEQLVVLVPLKRRQNLVKKQRRQNIWRTEEQWIRTLVGTTLTLHLGQVFAYFWHSRQ